MTTEPNSLTKSINNERMPALLDGQESLETWHNGSQREGYGLVNSFDPNKLRILRERFEKRDLAAT
jgi:putative SOS response-associated peptidase YedK